MFQAPAIPEGYRPRGSTAAARAAHSKLDCDHAPTARSRPRQKLAAMSVLRRSNHEPGESTKLYDAVRLAVWLLNEAIGEVAAN